MSDLKHAQLLRIHYARLVSRIDCNSALVFSAILNPENIELFPPIVLSRRNFSLANNIKKTVRIYIKINGRLLLFFIVNCILKD